MWNKVMQKIVSSNPIENFTPPDPITGRSPVLMGQLAPGDTNTILYYVDRNNPECPQPQNPSADPQYNAWQAGINNWLIRMGQAPTETPIPSAGCTAGAVYDTTTGALCPTTPAQ
jgi:hypothetical protein